MIDRDALLARVQHANPVPGSSPLPEELTDFRPPLALLIDERPGEVFSSPKRVPGRLGRRVRLAIAVAVVTVLVIGTPLLVLRGGDEEAPVATTVPTSVTSVPSVSTTAPATTVPPTTTPTEPPTTVSTVPARPGDLEITWQQVSSEAFEGGWIAAISQSDQQLIAVGGVRTGDFYNGQAFYQASVWVSSDGTTWERIDSSDFAVQDEHGSGSAYMTDVVVGPAGVVGVGWAGGRAAVWVSSDGVDWRRVPHDDAVFGTSGEIRHVVGASFGLVAVGAAAAGEGADEEVVAWVSPDGSEWTRSPLGHGAEAFALDYLGWANTRLDVVAWEDLVVAVGALDRDGDWTYRPAVWITDDGITWETIGDDSAEAISTPDGDDATLVAVAPYEDGLVAIGFTGDVARYPDYAMWTSQVGRDWQLGASEFFTEEPPWGFPALMAVADRMVLATSDPQSGTLFGSSDDGASWHPLGTVEGGSGSELAETEGDGFYWTVNDLGSFGDVVVAAGRTLAYSGSGDFGGRCSWDRGDGSAGACRTDAAVWIGTWEE